MFNRTDVPSDCRILLKTLRDVLKTRKFTYARLARQLGVSEVTVKRWFSGQTCSLRNIFEICEVLDLSFFDLAALAREDNEVEYVLTHEQEIFFSNKPAIFGLFKQLHRGENIDALTEYWKVTGPKMHGVLRSLEKLGLIDLLPEGRVRVKTRGNIRYGHQGPLASAILRPQVSQFLDHIDNVLKNDDVCLHSAEVELSSAHLDQFVDEVHALGAKYRARAYRDKSILPSEKLKSVRWLLALAPYQTNWRQYKI